MSIRVDHVHISQLPLVQRESCTKSIPLGTHFSALYRSLYSLHSLITSRAQVALRCAQRHHQYQSSPADETMDNKSRPSHALPITKSPQPAASMLPFARIRRFLIHGLAVLSLVQCLYALSNRYGFIGSHTTTAHLVPLEAHIISKCPDTRVCVSR